jgi:hypothetical protein
MDDTKRFDPIIQNPADAINVEDGPFKNHLYNSGTVWKFNSPHSSHMGGAWDRMIRTARQILNSMLVSTTGKAE